METVTANYFAGLNSVKIDLGCVAGPIRPQASGKSRFAKLLYFFCKIGSRLPSAMKGRDGWIRVQTSAHKKIRTVVGNQRGLSLILGTTSDVVPASTPICVSVRKWENCSVCVAFTGQVIQIAAQKLSVISNAHGGSYSGRKPFCLVEQQAHYHGRGFEN